ncbi:AAA family ATPase [Pseudoruegeria sp. HB172150]|uniref:AAA family ATPase n=1 Tax=Pseudoruegeria sp. HB172150 TaxID=2721164 RepID=UPI001554E086|nr:AAA family ATPase [Pseudoruegeria sp. HB172150]
MKTVYLTGAPGSGKTTSLDALVLKMPGLATWKYSEQLARHIQDRVSNAVDNKELRRASASLVSPEDILAVDNKLANFAKKKRTKQHLIIDSHPVTKEPYGFRCTAFTSNRLTSLGLDEIWVTYVDPDTTLSRLHPELTGRQPISREEAVMHTQLQAALAIQYGVLSGCPVHFFDTSESKEKIAARMQERLMKTRLTGGDT